METQELEKTGKRLNVNTRGLVRDINRVIKLVNQKESEGNIDFKVNVKFYDKGYKVEIVYPDSFFNQVIYDRSQGEYINYHTFYQSRLSTNKITGDYVEYVIEQIEDYENWKLTING